MKHSWQDLNYWKSGEWQVIQERLDDLDRMKKSYNPERHLMFAALDAVPYEKVRVMICGQDPYPNKKMATGIAFSIPNTEKNFPVTLQNIFKEYSKDLALPTPKSGNLDSWVRQGVLLWNVIPTCLTELPLSHQKWFEWENLTIEIIERLNERHIVFAFMGSVARTFARYVDRNNNFVIEVSHPSPRGNLNSKVPFVGSRLFSSINAHVIEQGLPPIEWRL